MTTANGQLVDLDERQARELLEGRVRRFMGISLDEFLGRLRRGDLPENATTTHLKSLVGAAAE